MRLDVRWGALLLLPTRFPPAPGAGDAVPVPPKKFTGEGAKACWPKTLEGAENRPPLAWPPPNGVWAVDPAGGRVDGGS